MDFLTRALLYLKKKIGKTIILLTIMLTLCVTTLAAFGIVSASEESSILARQKLGAEVTLQTDMEKMREELMDNMNNRESGGDKSTAKMSFMTPVPLEYVDELITSEYVQGYNVQSTTSANADSFDAITTTDDTSSDSTSNNMSAMMSGMGGGISSGNLSLVGINDITTTTAFIDGISEMIDGEILTDEHIGQNVVIIEETLATQNDLSVGDTITISNSDSTITTDLTIIGIYVSYAELNEMSFRSDSMLPYNQLYVPYTVVNEFKGEDYASAVDSVTFYLNDPINVDAFLAESQSTSIDFETFTLDANSNQYDSLMAPIENIADFSKISLIVVAIFGGSILALIIMLSIKDRITEIGILLSLGESKFKIVSQLLSEVLITLAIAISLSFVIGTPVTSAISNQLVQNELSTIEEESQFSGGQMPGGFGSGGKGNLSALGQDTGSNTELLETLEVKVNASDFMNMALISMLIAVVATIIPSTFVMRLNPKNILSKQ